MQNCLKPTTHKVWKFVHKTDFVYKTSILKSRSFDHDWLSVSPEGLIIVKGSYKNGYAWDGCTPKFNFLQITWGTCDGKLNQFSKGDYKPYAYYASMVHDIMYQYKRCAPITRKEADFIFYNLLKEAGFMWAPLYFIAVRLFGWYFKGWKYKKSIDIPLNIESD